MMIDVVPLNRFELFHTGDVAVAEEQGGRVFSPHRISPRCDSDFDARMRAVDIGALRVIYMTYGAELSISSREPLDYYAVNLPLDGAMRLRIGREDVVFDRSQAAMFSPEDSVRMSWSSDLAQLCVRIDSRALVEHVRSMSPTPLRGSLRFRPELPVDGRAAGWLPTLRILEDVLRRSPGRNVPPLVARQLEQLVMTTLVLSQPNSESEVLLAPVPAASLHAVRTACELMQECPEEAFTVADLAARTGVSVRSLQEGFRRQLGTTPTAYLEAVRLDRAWELIEQSDGRTTVADVAYRAGFVHLGRFATAYRKKFGSSPSHALRQRRTPG